MFAGKAASIGFGLRVNELYSLTVAALHFGADYVGEYVEYDAEFNKNHTCDMIFFSFIDASFFFNLLKPLIFVPIRVYKTEDPKG